MQIKKMHSVMNEHSNEVQIDIIEINANTYNILHGKTNKKSAPIAKQLIT